MAIRKRKVATAEWKAKKEGLGSMMVMREIANLFIAGSNPVSAFLPDGVFFFVTYPKDPEEVGMGWENCRGKTKIGEGMGKTINKLDTNYNGNKLWNLMFLWVTGYTAG